MAMQKLTSETLIAYAAGELAPERAAEVEALLRTSTEDARRLEHIRHMIETMRTDDSVAPSAEALTRARAIFQPLQRPSWRDWLEQLEILVANLTFDSRTRSVLSGYRGTTGAVQLSFESPAANVDLELLPPATPDASQWTLMGQISTERPATGVLVALVSCSDENVGLEIRPDEHGVFTTQAQPGDYDLFIRLPDRILRLADISIG